MLGELLLRKVAITRMFVHELDGMEHREPTRADWAIARKMVDVLEYPCTVVVKTQDKGHWMLSDALNRLGKMYVEF